MAHRLFTALLIIPLWLSMALLTTGAQAVEAKGPASPWSDTDYAQVRLVSATTHLGSDGLARLGLQFKLDDGWKVYWRSPGDAGYPPSLDWSASENMTESTMAWPAPERFSVLGLTSLGYKHEVIFPITAVIKQADQGLKAVAEVDYLTCNEVCVPMQTVLRLDLPPGDPKPSIFAHDIDRFRAKVPQVAGGMGIDLQQATFYQADENAGVLAINGQSTLPFNTPDIFVEGPKALEFAPTLVSLSSDGAKASFQIPVHGLKYFNGKLPGETLQLTLVDQSRAITTALIVTEGTGAAPDVKAPLSKPETTSPQGEKTTSPLLLMIGFALLGGLILNAMPCVLPVLSIKLLSLVKHGGGETRAVRFGFMASAAGVITSFMILAAGLLAVKSAGASIGWGIQFQQPVFLGFMMLVVTGFAMNLFGAFDVRMPGFLSSLGGSQPERGLGGHFLTGMLATLLATPCSAPFLGTAVAFALARGTVEILVIFFSLGLGLATPYILVALFPRVATVMPKPGPWMVTLKKVMGLALLATALWLLWVMAGVVSKQTLVFVGAFLGAFAIALALLNRGKAFAKIGKSLAVVSAIALLVIGNNIADHEPLDAAGRAEKNAAETIQWVAFDESKIKDHLAAGKTVFVDVTADWCITCQVNKSLVLSKPQIADKLNSGTVVAMQADWTRPSDTIADYLARFDRYGIPFNVIYSQAYPDGLALPEILSQSAVLNGLSAIGPNQAKTATSQ